jgi:TetR/AcrR family transcriptional repressor of nem operon
MGRPSEAREKLLAAAIDLIWAQSYGSVSVDQICEQAGVKKGSFYHFFPSKIDLAVEAFELHWSTDIQPLYDSNFRPEIPPRERMLRWCDLIYQEQKRRFDEHGHVPGCPFASMGAEMGTQNERLRLKMEELLERGALHLERALRDGVKDGSFRIDDIRSTARTVKSLGMGAMILAKVHNDPEVLRELVPQVFGLLGATQPV